MSGTVFLHGADCGPLNFSLEPDGDAFQMRVADRRSAALITLSRHQVTELVRVACTGIGLLEAHPPVSAPIYTGPAPIPPTDLPPLVVPVDQHSGD